MKDKKISILLLIVILLLIANTFAWFIFNENVSLSLETKVESWDLEFTYNEQEIEEAVDFEIESIYPGMPDESKTVVIKNNGEIAAEFAYKIRSIELLGEKMVVGENCSEEEIEEYVNNLPFEIKIEQEKDLIEKNGDSTEFKITFTWPFEDANDSNTITEKDKKDTKLGQKSYEYNNSPENLDGYNFKMKIELIAKQKNT